LISQLQIQDSTVLDEEVDISPSSKTAMVCKLAHVSPDIWNSLTLEAKKWLLNERKRQKLEVDKLKESSNSATRDNSRTSGGKTNNLNFDSNMANKYILEYITNIQLVRVSVLSLFGLAIDIVIHVYEKQFYV
jgi:hypothetical protein